MVETGVYRCPKIDRVVFGQPWAEALAESVTRTGARHVFVLGGATLFRTLPLPMISRVCSASATRARRPASARTRPATTSSRRPIRRAARERI